MYGKKNNNKRKQAISTIARKQGISQKEAERKQAIAIALSKAGRQQK